jgi:hypothetical protein
MTMRLLFILMTAFALALPISAQAGSKSGGGSKTPAGSATGGNSTGQASPSSFKHVANGKHFDNATLHVRKAGGTHVEY